MPGEVRTGRKGVEVENRGETFLLSPGLSALNQGYTEMISAEFVILLLREELQNRFTKFKFWKFWERPLYEIREYELKLVGL